jgi:ribosomal protein S18 acetylase RimI-like enzyme
MITIAKRLGLELRTRGMAGFVRFIAQRLAMWRADVLFECDLVQYAAAPAEALGAAIVAIDRSNFGSTATAQVEREVLIAANHAYIEELQGEGQLLAATDADGRVTSYAFIVFESFYKKVLGEARATPIICNCVTLPAYRGQGLYPQLLRASCLRLAAQGHRRAIITCAPDNIASMRGIEKAGFHRVKTLRSLILLARVIAIQRVD